LDSLIYNRIAAKVVAKNKGFFRNRFFSQDLPPAKPPSSPRGKRNGKNREGLKKYSKNVKEQEIRGKAKKKEVVTGKFVGP
jgi:hypothetical protein